MAILLGQLTDCEGAPVDLDAFALHCRRNPNVIAIYPGPPDQPCYGLFVEDGIYDGKMSYANPIAGYYIWWWAAISYWFITFLKGYPGLGWHRIDPSPIGPWLSAFGRPEVTTQWSPSCTLRRRIHGRRGGSGCKPGDHYGSPHQEKCRDHFGAAARRYVDMPLMNDVTFWEHAGQDRNWLTRDGSMKTMHGQAFYPRTVLSPDYVDAEFPDAPDLEAQPPPITDIKVIYHHATKQAAAYLWATDDFFGDEFSGFSVFQLNPYAIGHDWFHKQTHIVGHRSPFNAHKDFWLALLLDLHWPYTSDPELLIFVRVWYKNAFLNFGPTAAAPGPP